MNIREALAGGSAALVKGGIENAPLDASLLLAEVLAISRSSLLAAAFQPLTEESVSAFNGLITRRLAGECVAYITGKKEFYGLEFLVNTSVLVPRPDTETLVEAALQKLGMGNPPLRMLDPIGVHLKNKNHGEHGGTRSFSYENILLLRETPCNSVVKNFTLPPKVLDLCTGSGAIAIALKHEMPELEVWAADISAEALATAQKNATRLVPANTIRFCHGDLFDALDQEGEENASFHIIISNPPYVPTAVIEGLSPEVRREPLLALDGGNDGLDVIKRIIAQAPPFLCPGGSLLLEADPRQMDRIGALFHQAGFNNIQTHKDLSGNERVMSAGKN